MMALFRRDLPESMMHVTEATSRKTLMRVLRFCQRIVAAPTIDVRTGTYYQMTPDSYSV